MEQLMGHTVGRHSVIRVTGWKGKKEERVCRVESEWKGAREGARARARARSGKGLVWSPWIGKGSKKAHGRHR